jgi:hypothetical protein
LGTAIERLVERNCPILLRADFSYNQRLCIFRDLPQASEWRKVGIRKAVMIDENLSHVLRSVLLVPHKWVNHIAGIRKQLADNYRAVARDVVGES